MKGEISRAQQRLPMDNPSRSSRAGNSHPHQQVWDLVLCLRQGEVSSRQRKRKVN